MYLSANTLRKIKPVDPFVERGVFRGMSYGLSLCGYDIRIAEQVTLNSNDFSLASSIERFEMPKNVVGFVHDKSTWARRGLQVQNTVIEPGWEGYLTLELSTSKLPPPYRWLYIEKGAPIAQILFAHIDEDTEGYTGKYQNQEEGSQGPRYE